MKSTPKKVFIIENGQYKEITYQQHQERKSKGEGYVKRWFIPVHDYLLETSREQYTEYYRTAERNKYLKKLDKKFGLRSLDLFQGEEKNIAWLMAINEEDITERIVQDND